jgi:uncharacterized protein YoxC
VEHLIVAAEVLALLAVTALCIYLIIVLVRVKSLLGQVEKDVREISTRALPILENTEYITSRAKSIAESIDDQVLTFRESIASLRQIADNVVELERKVQERIEGPILDGLSFVAALVKGLRAFKDRIRS